MIATTDFYAPRRQVVRVLKLNGRLHGLDVLFGVFYVIMGFYLLRKHGASRVVEVIGPCLCLTGVMLYLALHVFAPSARGATRPFYFNLPQSLPLAWMAQSLFLLLIYLALVGVLFAAVAAGLGSVGVPLQYRVSPDLLALPIYAMGLGVWSLHNRTGWGPFLLQASAAALPVAWLFVRIFMHERAGVQNDFTPSPHFSQPQLWAAAAAMAGGGAAMVWMAWRKQRKWMTGEDR